MFYVSDVIKRRQSKLSFRRVYGGIAAIVFDVGIGVIENRSRVFGKASVKHGELKKNASLVFILSFPFIVEPPNTRITLCPRKPPLFRGLLSCGSLWFSRLKRRVNLYLHMAMTRHRRDRALPVPRFYRLWFLFTVVSDSMRHRVSMTMYQDDYVFEKWSLDDCFDFERKKGRESNEKKKQIWVHQAWKRCLTEEWRKANRRGILLQKVFSYFASTYFARNKSYGTGCLRTNSTNFSSFDFAKI